MSSGSSWIEFSRSPLDAGEPRPRSHALTEGRGREAAKTPRTFGWIPPLALLTIGILILYWLLFGSYETA